MPIKLSMSQDDTLLKPRILVVGVGGAGGNAVNNMIQCNLDGVDFVVCNTDSQALHQSLSSRKIQLGTNITKGLGAGSRPEIGSAAAQEALDEITEHLSGAHMVFVTAGMGGGTGTGAAPVIAAAARELGILTVGVVTKPFHFEGQHRMRSAEKGIEELQNYVDTLIVIPNQNLFRLANEKTTFADAFKMADDVLHSGVRGVTDLMVMPGLINLDFADIRTVMSEMGKAMMGTGEASGEKRAIDAAESAISNPLLDDVSMKGARGILINITGGYDMTLFEVDEAANRIREEVDPDANIIFGSTFQEDLDGIIRVSVVATGIEAEQAAKNKTHHSFHTNAYGKKPGSSSQEKELALDLSRGEERKTSFGFAKPTATPSDIPAARTASQMMNPAPTNNEAAEHFILEETIDVETLTLEQEPASMPNHVQPIDPFEEAAQENARPSMDKSKSKLGFFSKQNATYTASAMSQPKPSVTAEEPALALREPLEERSSPNFEPDEDVLDIPAFLRRQAN